MEQAHSLATLTGDAVAVVAGDEPKMVQTLEPLAKAVGCDVEAAVELRESHSEGWLGDEEFDAVVRHFLADRSASPARGWESADAVAGRFVGKLGRLVRAASDDGTIVVCSGGRALTAALHGMGLLAPADLYRTWRNLRMPDVAEVLWHDDGALLRSPFGSTNLDGSRDGSRLDP